MLVILVLGILTQNSHATETNHTEVLETLKLFKRILNKDKMEEITPVPPMSKPEILSYIHNLNPDLLNRPSNANIHDDHHLPLLVDPRENTERTINKDYKEGKKENTDKDIDSKLDEKVHRRLNEWFQKLFDIKTDRKPKNKGNSTKLTDNNTTKLTTEKKTITKKLTTTKKLKTTKSVKTLKKTTSTPKPTTESKIEKLRAEAGIDFDQSEELEQDSDRDEDNELYADIEDDEWEKRHSRRLLSWFKNLFGVTGATTTTTELPTPAADENFNMVMKLRADNVENNLTVILTEINKVLQKFNENLEKRNSKNVTTGFLVLRVPVQSQANREITNRRRKREINNSTTEAPSDNNSNVTRVSGARRMMNVIPIKNFNGEANHFNGPTENRNINYGASELKDKLIKLIAESFKDIKQKISPLKTIKDKYSGDDLFVVGYVMASLDTLEVNLTKLIDEMEMKKHLWNESKLMELFERLNTSNSVINKLMNSLKKYTDINT